MYMHAVYVVYKEAITGYREWQLMNCVESGKHGLIVDLIIIVILGRKSQGAGTVATSSGRRKERRRNSYRRSNRCEHMWAPLGLLAPFPPTRFDVWQT